MKELESLLDCLCKEKTVENIFVRVGKGEKILYDTRRGSVDETTLFDMASVTKVMATTSLALIALDKGLLKLDDPVSKFYPTQKKISIQNLLTHTVGIGHKAINKEGNTYENIAEKILEIPQDIPIGQDVLYSCPAYILLGKILERIYQKRLDQAFEEFVAKPLKLNDTSFLPKRTENCVNANDQEEKRGVVNDYNCQFLGGVAGNAGLFSNIIDVTKYAQCLIKKGAPLIRETTFDTAVKNYTANTSQSRALGFVFVDERYEQAGGLFSYGSIGHCGHTGQSVFVDKETGLFVIVLSDATRAVIRKYGNERYGEVIKMREEIHSAIKKDLQN